jgi:hypothetical protein
VTTPDATAPLTVVHPAQTHTTDTRVVGAWLREQRQARGWSRPALAQKIIKHAHAEGDRSVPGLDSMCHNIYRWERGADGISERYRLYLCMLFDIPPASFGPSGHAQPSTAAVSPAASPADGPVTVVIPAGCTQVVIHVTCPGHTPPAQ